MSEESQRHWRHWRWLNTLPFPRYQRAIATWKRLFGVWPRGIVYDCHGWHLNLVKEDESCPSSKRLCS